ncbi:hypothetical protein [Helcococcus sueciensis]|uniref:hypothetical protein n=1 Tax=Helcococcus sueciensis TaxID=241555 RepID=UPI0004239CA0|nr:hypothetical protein [Helcococcus sueciensis]
MTVGELILTNKDRYTKVYLIKNDKLTNEAVFVKADEKSLDEKTILIEAKDYFILDKEGIDEIFGNSKDLNVNDEDKVLLIGI